MFKCHICGSTKAHRELVSEVFQIDGEPVLVQNIPVQACSHCGEEVFASETVEKVRLLVHGNAKPVKSIKMDVFSYA